MKKPTIPPEHFAEVLAAARLGDFAALGELLESSRLYLLYVAKERLPRQLTSKMGGSDLVQETFILAQKCFGKFKGSTEAELLAWLRHGLMMRLAYQLRAFKQFAKHNVGREVPLREHGREARQIPFFMDGDDTPDIGLEAREQATAMKLAMQLLSDNERYVIGLRFGDKWSWEQIGTEIGISADGARKLCTRALRYMGHFAKKVHLEGPPV